MEQPIIDVDEVPESGAVRAKFFGRDVIVTRVHDRPRVFVDVCPHFGGPLEQGDREGDTIVCPWHKSRFDLCSGEAIDGPAVFPQSRYETRVRDGRIEVRAAEKNVQEKVT